MRGEALEWASRVGRTTVWVAGMAWYFLVGWWLAGLLYLLGYLLLLTVVGRRPAERVFDFTLDKALLLGRDPPGRDRLAKAAETTERKGEEGSVRRFVSSIRSRWRRSHAARLYERLTRDDPPPSPPTRVLWFVLVGWWFAGAWTFVAWLAVLPPYPLVDISRGLLRRVPDLLLLPAGGRRPYGGL
jgi:hypothetical protein